MLFFFFDLESVNAALERRPILGEVERGIFLRILSYTVIVLVFVNIAVVSGTCALYIEYWQLEDLEQSRLEEVFPRLPDEKLSELLNRFFPGFTSYHRETRGSLVRYEVSQGWTLLGVAYQIREDISCPVCADVRALIEVRNGKIGNIILIDPFHLYGKPMPVELQQSFIAQFENKAIKERMLVGFNVDGISGATKSTEKFVTGIYRIKLDMERDSK